MLKKTSRSSANQRSRSSVKPKPISRSSANIDKYNLNFGVEIEIILKKTEKFISLLIKYLFDEKEYNNIIDIQNELSIIFSYNPYKDTFSIIDNFIKDCSIINISSKKFEIDKEKAKKFFLDLDLCGFVDFFTKATPFVLCNYLKETNNSKLTISHISHNIEYRELRNRYMYIGTINEEEVCNKGKEVLFYFTVDSSVNCSQFDAIYYKNIENPNFVYVKYEKNNPVIEKHNIYDHLFIPFSEFVSGIFKNKEEVKNGTTILFNTLNEMLRDKEDEIVLFNNYNTSNHIHFSINIENKVVKEPNLDLILVFSCLWCVLEPFIFKLCNIFRRNNRYTKGCKKNIEIGLYNLNEFFGSETNYNNKFKLLADKISDDKYFALNLLNIRGLKKNENDDKDYKPTFEIRLKHGTDDSNEIYMFCDLIETIFFKAVYDYNTFFKLDENKKVNIIEYYLNQISKVKEINEDRFHDLNMNNTNDKTIVDEILACLYEDNSENTTKKKNWIQHINAIKKFNDGFKEFFSSNINEQLEKYIDQYPSFDDNYYNWTGSYVDAIRKQ